MTTIFQDIAKLLKPAADDEAASDAMDVALEAAIEKRRTEGDMVLNDHTETELCDQTVTAKPQKATFGRRGA